MSYVLVDEEEVWSNLLPLTFTRPVSHIRTGIMTISERWERLLGENCSVLAHGYLRPHFRSAASDDNIFILSCVFADELLVAALQKLEHNTALIAQGRVIAYRGKEWFGMSDAAKIAFDGEVRMLRNVWDVFSMCGTEIIRDFELLTAGRKSAKLHESVTVIGDRSRVFIEEGASVYACILNVNNGPVYIGKDAEVMEGCTVRGPFSLGDHSVLKMSAKIYGPTVIGPHSKVGGEVSNSVIFGYSNKAHDGFVGNSVIGEWCNLGADTNCSNLKNNYGSVKVYNYPLKQQADSGLQFCGLIMGDHSRSGINTMFNTGTVVGVACNIFGGGFPPVHIPSFSWGGAEKLEPYKPEKMFETAVRVYQRRGIEFGEKERAVLGAIKAFTAQ